MEQAVRLAKKSTAMIKIAWAAVDIALFFFVISFSSPDWLEFTSHPQYHTCRLGLWKACFVTKEGEAELCGDSTQLTSFKWSSDWVTGLQVSATLSFISLILSALFVNGYAFVPRLEYNIASVFVAMCTAFSSVMFGCVALTVLGNVQANNDDLKGISKLSWAYGLCATATVLTFISVVAMFLEFVNSNSRRAQRRRSVRAISKDGVTMTSLGETTVASAHEQMPSEEISPTFKRPSFAESLYSNYDDVNVEFSAAAVTASVELPHPARLDTINEGSGRRSDGISDESRSSTEVTVEHNAAVTISHIREESQQMHEAPDSDPDNDVANTCGNTLEFMAEIHNNYSLGSVQSNNPVIGADGMEPSLSEEQDPEFTKYADQASELNTLGIDTLNDKSIPKVLLRTRGRSLTDPSLQLTIPRHSGSNVSGWKNFSHMPTRAFSHTDIASLASSARHTQLQRYSDTSQPVYPVPPEQVEFDIVTTCQSQKEPDSESIQLYSQKLSKQAVGQTTHGEMSTKPTDETHPCNSKNPIPQTKTDGNADCPPSPPPRAPKRTGKKAAASQPQPIKNNVEHPILTVTCNPACLSEEADLTERESTMELLPFLNYEDQRYEGRPSRDIHAHGFHPDLSAENMDDAVTSTLESEVDSFWKNESDRNETPHRTPGPESTPVNIGGTFTPSVATEVDSDRTETSHQKPCPISAPVNTNHNIESQTYDNRHVDAPKHEITMENDPSSKRYDHGLKPPAPQRAKAKDIKPSNKGRTSNTGDTRASQGNRRSSTADKRSSTGDTSNGTGNTKRSTDHARISTGNTRSSTDTRTRTGNTKSNTDNTRIRTGNTRSSTDDTRTRTGNTRSSTDDTRTGTGKTRSSTDDKRTRTGNTKSSTDDTRTSTGDTRSKKDDTGGSKGNTGGKKETGSSIGDIGSSKVNTGCSSGHTGTRTHPPLSTKKKSRHKHRPVDKEVISSSYVPSWVSSPTKKNPEDGDKLHVSHELSVKKPEHLHHQGHTQHHTKATRGAGASTKNTRGDISTATRGYNPNAAHAKTTNTACESSTKVKHRKSTKPTHGNSTGFTRGRTTKGSQGNITKPNHGNSAKSAHETSTVSINGNGVKCIRGNSTSSTQGKGAQGTHGNSKPYGKHTMNNNPQRQSQDYKLIEVPQTTMDEKDALFKGKGSEIDNITAADGQNTHEVSDNIAQAMLPRSECHNENDSDAASFAPTCPIATPVIEIESLEVSQSLTDDTLEIIDLLTDCSKDVNS